MNVVEERKMETGRGFIGNVRKEVDYYHWATQHKSNKQADCVPFKVGDDIFAKISRGELLHALVKF